VSQQFGIYPRDLHLVYIRWIGRWGLDWRIAFWQHQESSGDCNIGQNLTTPVLPASLLQNVCVVSACVVPQAPIICWKCERQGGSCPRRQRHDWFKS